MSKIEIEDRTAETDSGINVRVMIDDGKVLALFSGPTQRLSLEPGAAKVFGQLLIAGATTVLETKN